MPNGNDVLVISEKVSNTYVSKGMTVNNFFANVQVNTAFHSVATHHANVTFQNLTTFTANVQFDGVLTISGDQMVIATRKTPANSTITVTQGTIFYDTDYLYVTTANNIVKRVALNSF